MMKTKETVSQQSILSVLREKVHLFPSKRLYTFLSPTNKSFGKLYTMYTIFVLTKFHNVYLGSFHEVSSLTYSEFYHHQSATLAKALLRNVSISDKQERILLVYPPSLDFIIAFFGCLLAGLSIQLIAH